MTAPINPAEIVTKLKNGESVRVTREQRLAFLADYDNGFMSMPPGTLVGMEYHDDGTQTLRMTEHKS